MHQEFAFESWPTHPCPVSTRELYSILISFRPCPFVVVSFRSVFLQFFFLSFLFFLSPFFSKLLRIFLAMTFGENVFLFGTIMGCFGRFIFTLSIYFSCKYVYRLRLYFARCLIINHQYRSNQIFHKLYKTKPLARSEYQSKVYRIHQQSTNSISYFKFSFQPLRHTNFSTSNVRPTIDQQPLKFPYTK